MALTLALAALLALIAASTVIFPLLRAGPPPIARGQYDRAVYRHQLLELEKDEANGAITHDEAATARLEIQRRLLALGDPEVPGNAAAVRRRPGAAATVAAVITGFAAIVYAWLGSPGLPDRPFTASADLLAGPAAANPHQGGDADTATLAAALRAKLDANPDNLDGWLLYARTESRIREWGKAAEGYGNAIALGEKTVDTEAGYGEMLVLAAQGVVTPVAVAAFQQALEIDPKDQASRYYLALADAQAGRTRQAVDSWLALAAELPGDSPTRAELARRITETARLGGFPAPVLPLVAPVAAPDAAPPGPTAEQMATAGTMSDAERNAMIEGMIDKLADELAAKPGNLDGWLRLARAYAVRGEVEKSSMAFDHAIALKPADAEIVTQALSTLLSRLAPGEPPPARTAAWLRDLAQDAPDSPDLLWLQGVVAAQQGHPDQARSLWTRLLGKLPKDDDSYSSVTTALANLPAVGK